MRKIVLAAVAAAAVVFSGVTSMAADESALSKKELASQVSVFPVGEENPYGAYFIGQSYLQRLVTEGVPIGNVTFEPGCRNNWHIHHNNKQILLVTGGRGFYQEWGKAPVELLPGDVVEVPPGTKHWHGAAPDSWFSHLSVEAAQEGAYNEWLEPVTDDQYSQVW